MRIPGWLLGLFGFVILTGMTGLCALVSFGGVRQIVIDLWDSGVEVNTPGEVVSAVFSDNPINASQPGDSIITLPSPTPELPQTAAVDTIVDATEEVIPPVALERDGTPTPDAIVADAALPTPTIAPTLDPLAAYEWNDPRQVRILLLGIDQRSGEQIRSDEGPPRTDTMIVVNVDPVRKTAGVISFPRDLWVDIPTFGAERINFAHRAGELNAYPNGGGPKLAMDTVEANFGIRVDHFIAVNFTVFETVVDTVAPTGVEVCVDERIYDPDYPDDNYGTIVVEFQPGCQFLNGERLLQYARNRATDGGDFDRARRQQKTLDALRETVLSAGGVANFLTQIPALWNELSGAYETDLSLEQIIALGRLMSEIPGENINFAVISEDYVSLAQGPNEQDILLPEPARISDLVQRIFYPQLELTRADLLQRSEAENATVRVYNGTDVTGLAGRTQEWLAFRGIAVAGVGNDTNHNGANTVIRDYGNNRWTSLYLADLLGLPPERIEPGTDGLAADGVIVVVGPDIQPLLSGE